MSIPYHFDTPIPKWFRENGFFAPSNRLRVNNIFFLQWAFARCSCKPNKILHDGRDIYLEPFEFIFGLKVCSEETGLTIKEVRHQVKVYKNLNLLVDTKNAKKNRFSSFKWTMEARADCLIQNGQTKGQTKGQTENQPTLYSEQEIENQGADQRAGQWANKGQTEGQQSRPKTKEKMDIDRDFRAIHSSKLNGEHIDFGVAQGFALELVKVTIKSLNEEDIKITSPKAFLKTCFENTRKACEYAKTLNGKSGKSYRIDVGYCYLEFVPLGTGNSIRLDFTEKDFAQKVEEEAKRLMVVI